jgi:hypothetical protein
MKLSNNLVSALGTVDHIQTEGSSSMEDARGGDALPSYQPVADGIEFAPASRFGSFLDTTWEGEKKPKKEKDKDTVTCPVGQEPTIVIDGRDVTVTCGPASPDKPKGGFPVPIIY